MCESGMLHRCCVASTYVGCQNQDLQDYNQFPVGWVEPDIEDQVYLTLPIWIP